MRRAVARVASSRRLLVAPLPHAPFAAAPFATARKKTRAAIVFVCSNCGAEHAKVRRLGRVDALPGILRRLAPTSAPPPSSPLRPRPLPSRSGSASALRAGRGGPSRSSGHPRPCSPPPTSTRASAAPPAAEDAEAAEASVEEAEAEVAEELAAVWAAKGRRPVGRGAGRRGGTRRPTLPGDSRR